MGQFILKLKDEPRKSNGRYDDTPLYFHSIIDGNGFWEYIPSLARIFESEDDAFDVAAKENALKAFNAKDELFIIDLETTSVRAITRKELSAARPRWEAVIKEEVELWRARELEAEQQREAIEEAKSKARQLERGLKPAVPAITIEMHDEIVGLTTGGRPDIFNA